MNKVREALEAAADMLAAIRKRPISAYVPAAMKEVEGKCRAAALASLSSETGGEVVAWMRPADGRIVTAESKANAMADDDVRCNHDGAAYTIPLYAHPPAPIADVGELPEKNSNTESLN